VTVVNREESTIFHQVRVDEYVPVLHILPHSLVILPPHAITFKHYLHVVIGQKPQFDYGVFFGAAPFAKWLESTSVKTEL